MPKFLDTTGEPTLGIGICDRCSRKMPLAELYEDPNAPGLRVCEADRDQLDPWRLPARQPEELTLPFYRPDTPIGVPGTQPTATKFQVNGNWYWNVDGPEPSV